MDVPNLEFISFGIGKILNLKPFTKANLPSLNRIEFNIMISPELKL